MSVLWALTGELNYQTFIYTSVPDNIQVLWEYKHAWFFAHL